MMSPRRIRAPIHFCCRESAWHLTLDRHEVLPTPARAVYTFGTIRHVETEPLPVRAPSLAFLTFRAIQILFPPIIINASIVRNRNQLHGPKPPPPSPSSRGRRAPPPRADRDSAERNPRLGPAATGSAAAACFLFLKAETSDNELLMSPIGGDNDATSDDGRPTRGRRHPSNPAAVEDAAAFAFDDDDEIEVGGDAERKLPPSSSSSSSSSSMLDDVEAAAASATREADDAPVADGLDREIARLRRRLQLLQQQQQQQHQAQKAGGGAEWDDAEEVGFGPGDGADGDASLLPRDDDAARRPGAYRVGGTGRDDDDDDSRGGGGGEASEDGESGHRRAVEEAAVTRLAAGRSDAFLLEADLVEEQEAVEATIVRRKRQALAVAGLVLLSCAIVGVTTGVLLSRPKPRPTPAYRFANVSSMQAAFNASLPSTTLDEINRGSTPPSDAYRWLFASVNGHPDLPKTDALPRLVHRFALATLFYATGGNDTWVRRTGWLDPTEHECLWHGVTCPNGTSVALGSCTNEFGIRSVSCQSQHATTIEALDLTGNGLNRALPREIALLRTSNIARVKLDDNNLAGAIPAAIEELTSLELLSLIRNKIGRTLPAAIGSLTNLEGLSVSQNKLTGTIPASLANLVKLKDLDLSQNGLTGGIPTEIGFMASLISFVASSNSLQGTIPSELAKLTRLATLDLSGNLFAIVFSDGFGRAMKNLQVLALSDNDSNEASSGTSIAGNPGIPSQIGDFASLTRLELSSCGLFGTIPTELGRLENLEHFLCRSNSLTGSLPTELGSLRSLITWNTGDNSLRGTLPSALARLTALQEFTAATNRHDGPIPAGFGNMSSLRVWDTRTNILTGPIPSALGMLTALEVFMVDGTFCVSKHEEVCRSP
jgi:Leucine-rich repeat (LRR) protein